MPSDLQRVRNVDVFVKPNKIRLRDSDPELLYYVIYVHLLSTDFSKERILYKYDFLVCGTSQTAYLAGSSIFSVNLFPKEGAISLLTGLTIRLKPYFNLSTI